MTELGSDAIEETRAAARQPPRTFASGRYVVRQRLGEGGQKTVYLVHDTTLERDCALSLIKAEALDPESVLRVQREAQTMARLAHPNIVTIYDFGEEEGPDGQRRPYIVCEYMSGGDLLQELRRADGPVALERALDIASDIARALAAAHERGIVHRDVKPANVFLSDASPTSGRRSSAKLGDFGVAVALDRSRLTMTGMVTGTAAYMAPEQARGAEVDARSDLYALGCLLYELVTGRPPFVGDDPQAVISQHINAAPAAPSQYAEVPEALDALVLRLLAKAPEERSKNATEVLAALEAIAEAPHETAPRGEAQAVRKAGRVEQEIRFCSARDGVRLACATVGAGFPLIKAANWLSHLEFDWQSPIWRHLFRALAADHQLIRYDERGTGLSDREVEHMSFEDWVSDLEIVVDATGLDRFALLGISQGGPVAVAYAVRHPERVSHLILYGSFARFPRRSLAEEQALLVLMHAGWGRETAEYRQVFTSMFIPEATAEQMRWFNELERRSASPETAARILTEIWSIDVREMAACITVPTLILHCHDDQAVPFSGGRELAALVPGARFVPLEGSNHYFLEHDSAREVFLRELNAFLGD
jgi:pimeloyl-ACP methyl ester carboxylesterase